MNKKFIIRKAIAFLVVLCVLFSSCFITINAQDSSELQTMVLIGDESNPNIYGAVRQNSKHIYQGSYSFYSACSTTGGSDYNQWGLRANAQMFDIDFTDYLSNGAIVFWAYVDGDVKGVEAGQSFDQRCQRRPDGNVVEGKKRIYLSQDSPCGQDLRGCRL